MRPRLVIQVLSVAVIGACATVWIKSRMAAVDLQAQLATLGARTVAARSLEQQRDQLRSELANAVSNRRANATGNAYVPAQSAPRPAVSSALPLGQWCSARDWRNEGQSTARNTVSTLLWAAAGGDVTAMTSILLFDDTSRKLAQTFFDSLSPAERQSFPSPEALIASLTVAAIPNHAAQLSWFHERDSDHATVGLLLGAPEETRPARVPTAGPNDIPPPMGRVDRATKLTVLSLQRSSNGWQVLVPAAAIERLARGHVRPRA